MSSGADEREPLRETLCVEEGHNTRQGRAVIYDEEYYRPISSILETAKKYAPLAVCVSATIVAICALSSVAMIGAMQSRMTPEAVANAAANKLLASSALGGLAYADSGNLPIWPKTSGIDALADMLKVNWNPMFGKLAAAWKNTAEVYEGAAKNLAADPSELDEEPMGGMIFSYLTEVAAFMRTASEAVHMLGSMDPPTKETEVSVTEFSKDATVLDKIIGLNGIEDADGDASMPLAVHLQQMLRPQSLLSAAKACVQFVDRLNPSSWTMHSYSTSLIGRGGICLQPEADDFWSFLANPLTGEPLIDDLPFDSAGSGGKSPASPYGCSLFGNTPLCMCSREISYEEEVAGFGSIKATCERLATALSNSLSW